MGSSHCLFSSCDLAAPRALIKVSVETLSDLVVSEITVITSQQHLIQMTPPSS